MSWEARLSDKTASRPFGGISPGEMLDDELQARNMTQVQLTERIKVSPSVVNEIIECKCGMTADFACRLEVALGTPSYMWVGWQAEFDLQTVWNNSSTKTGF